MSRKQLENTKKKGTFTSVSSVTKNEMRFDYFRGAVNITITPTLLYLLLLIIR